MEEVIRWSRRCAKSRWIDQAPRLPTADDPNETIILMEYKDLKTAKTFGESADLKKTMAAAGVVDKPTIYFVEQA